MFSYSLGNLDDDKLRKSKSVKSSIIEAVKQGVVFYLPSGYSNFHLEVTLDLDTDTEAEVDAVIRISPKAGDTGAKLLAELSSDAQQNLMKQRVRKKLLGISNLDTTTVSGKSIEDLYISCAA